MPPPTPTGVSEKQLSRGRFVSGKLTLTVGVVPLTSIHRVNQVYRCVTDWLWCFWNVKTLRDRGAARPETTLSVPVQRSACRIALHFGASGTEVGSTLFSGLCAKTIKRMR